MKIRNNRLVVIAGLFLFALMQPLSQASASPPAMTNYCIQPPFLTARTQPNVMIILDNSGSMKGNAYTGTYKSGTWATNPYYGYFDPTKNYQYFTSATPTAANPNRWVPTAADMDSGTATNPIASGNFLNWATMKRIDIAKKVLIGGKASSGLGGTAVPSLYNVADRTTNPVRLYGHHECQGCGTSNFDATAVGNANTIYPPNASPGNYVISMSNTAGSGNQLTIADSGSIVTTRTINPTCPGLSVPAAWWPPTATALAACQAVDEVTLNTADYIKNITTQESIVLPYSYAGPTTEGIVSVEVHAVTKVTKQASNPPTVFVKGVLRSRTDLVGTTSDTASVGVNINADSSYTDHFFPAWTTNPITGTDWTWPDLTTTGIGSIAGFGVSSYTTLSGSNPNSTNYASVAQIYLVVKLDTAAGTFNIIVDQGTTPASGILDKLVADATSVLSQVRFGFTIYNYDADGSSNQGGYIANPIDFNNVPNIVKSISSLAPVTNTPLGETLYEVVRYFRQESPYYATSKHCSESLAANCSSNSDCNSTGAGQTCVSSADYTTGTLALDPYYYTGTTNQYVPCTNTFIMLLTDGESTQDKNLPGSGTKAPCSLTNIKKCSGYTPTGFATPGNLPDPRYAGTAVGETFPDGVPSTDTGTDYLVDVAFWARANDMRDKSGGCTTKPITWSSTDHCLPKVQNIYFYPVYMFGVGSTLLKDAAIYGGFDDINKNGIPDCISEPAECFRDSNGDGIIKSNGTDDPITYYQADNGYDMETNISQALSAIVRRTAAGTAASVLASGEGSGANLLQAIFYPRRSITNQPDIYWSSTLTNLWYYLDKSSNNSTIRENTADTVTNGVMELNLDKDYIVKFSFDPVTQTSQASLYADANADGIADTPATPTATVDASDLKYLWEAGILLWNKDADSRTIYTNVTGTATMTSFIKGNLGAGSPTTLQTLLNTDTSRGATNNPIVARNIVSYVRGYDTFCSINKDTPCSSTIPCPGGAGTCGPTIVLTVPSETISYRSRTTGIDLNKNDTILDTTVSMKNGETWSEAPKVWKLGDIVNATPRIVSWIPLNTYHTTYNDSTYSAYIASSTYKARNMVFAGANDGMLHAFTLGTLDVTTTGNIVAKLCQDDGAGAGGIANNGICEAGEKNKGNLGKEQWAFIPKGALPYLQYLADPNYCHLYYVDATPYVFDASIEAPGSHTTDYWTQTKGSSSWRTILIGGMRLGGACKNAATAFEVQTPATSIGYSSYFAIDITDPTSPQFMWEFSNPNLGFASNGAGIVKINARNSSGSGSTDTSTADTTKDGKWFVVLASGPTGPVGTSQFRGYSDQNLSLFVLDLKTGSLLTTIDTGITNAFGGSLNNASIDYDFDYQDDALYMGYTKSEVATPSGTTIWNKGGVLRLITRANLNGHDVSPTATAAASGTALNPANWLWTKVVDNIGAVSSSVAHLAHYPLIGKIPDKAYLYFGSGRYFYPSDDASTGQALYGIIEPCLSKIKSITTAASPVCDDNSHGTATACSNSDSAPTKDNVDSSSCLKNATSNAALTSAPNGWFINLDASVGTAYSERMITDPLAAQTGSVFFTTFAPDSDICSFGGATRLWAVKYDTAAAVGSSLQGIGLLQVSTGAIKEVGLHTDFGLVTDSAHKYGRRTDDIGGVPPTGQGLSIIVPPKPVDTILHIRKK